MQDRINRMYREMTERTRHFKMKMIHFQKKQWVKTSTYCVLNWLRKNVCTKKEKQALFWREALHIAINQKVKDSVRSIKAWNSDCCTGHSGRPKYSNLEMSGTCVGLKYCLDKGTSLAVSSNHTIEGEKRE